MAINPHDDYEKLAKLLYPSIEASGNVYYGQTRKLTMDEVLNKNDLGFESHVETEREYSYTGAYQYRSYFKWKLGPLSGSILFNVENSGCTFKSFPSERYATVLSLYNDESDYIVWPTDSYIESEGISSDYTNENFPAADFRNDNLYGSVFIKYKLVFEEKCINNTINSGQYNTYERSVSCYYVGLYVSYNCSPIDKDDYYVEGRNFYIHHDDATDEWYLYVQVYNNYNGYYASKNLQIDQPLTITAVSNTATVAITDHGDIASKCSFSYKLSTSSNDAWQPYTYNTAIHFNRDESVQFRLESITILPTGLWPYSDQNYVQIIFGQNDTVEASGDIRSLLYAIFNNNAYNALFNTAPPPYLFYRLFYNDNQLIKAPKLPLCKVGSGAYREMFYGTSIVESPKLLPVSSYYTAVYQSMFENCHSLTKAPVIYSSSPSMMHYNMLKGCDNITYIDASYLKDYDYDSTVYGLTIADSLPSAGTFVYPDNKQRPANTYGAELFVGIDNWDFIKSETSKESIIRNGNSPVNAKYNSSCVTTFGADNSDNGRGSVLDESTLNNMEKSFDENDTHRMNTYNKDGSYNQEIWGYKSFNSPVQFRNGIYGENSSVIAISENIGINDIAALTYSVYNQFGNVEYSTTVVKQPTTKIGSTLIDKNNNFTISSSNGNITCESTFIDPNDVQHDIDFTLENCYISSSEISTKVNDNTAKIYTRIAPAVHLDVVTEYIQDMEAGTNSYEVWLNELTHEIQSESCISAGKAFVKVVSSSDSSSSAIIEADNTIINSVRIMPNNHLGENELCVFNNGGLYLLALKPLSAPTSRVVLNCGSIVKSCGGNYYDKWVVYNGNINTEVNLGLVQFVNNTGDSVVSNIGWYGNFSGVPTIKFKLLAPITFQQNQQTTKFVFAICVQEGDE